MISSRNIKTAVCTALLATLTLLALPSDVHAQKRGGILRIPNLDSPASMSIHEEATVVSAGPMMPVFNNLVLFDQHVPQNSLQSIVPELATSWSWNDDKTQLKFVLRQGVKWHDGKPFTAADVKCTWDLLLGKSAERLRVNPRKSWYRNLEGVTANGDYEARFPPQAAATRLYRATGVGLVAGLSLPCAAGADAAASDRHRPIQVRRVQAERVDQGGAQSGLLETRPALSRRHRIHGDPQHLDRRSWRWPRANSTAPGRGSCRSR